MTLAPIENRNVRGVAAEKYPLNPFCSNPECDNPTADPHHIFRRSAIGGSSWFVVIAEETESGALVEHDPIPHVTGLCRECHDKINEHEFWIKYEGDVFVLYARNREATWVDGYTGENEWVVIGSLFPQPGGHDAVPKPRRRALKGEERRKRRTISIKVPADTEDGGAVWDETLDRVKERLILLGLYDEGDLIPNYEALIAALNDWLNTDPREESSE